MAGSFFASATLAAMRTMLKAMRECLSILSFVRLLRCAWFRSFLEVLLFHYVVTCLDPFPRSFHLIAIQHQRRAITDHANDQALRCLRKSIRQFVESPNFLAVHFIYNRAAIGCQIGVDRVR